MPKISVLTVTCRTDLYLIAQQVQALNAQKFKDFEWVVIDDHYDQTKRAYKEYVGKSLRLIHKPPDMVVPYFARAAALNDGLALCNGEIIYFMCDYVIPEPTCFGRHWDVQQKYGGVMLTGRRVKIEMPIEEFATIIHNKDKKSKVAWSDFNLQLFETDKKLTWTPLDDDCYEVHKDGYNRWMSGRNDSCPLSALLEVNGFDQICDGSWGAEDADIAARLQKFGVKFIIDKKSSVMELPHKSAEKRQLRSDGERLRIQEQLTREIEAGRYRANELFIIAMPRDLKAEREEIRHDSN